MYLVPNGYNVYSFKHVFFIDLRLVPTCTYATLLLESMLNLNFFQVNISFPSLENYILNGFGWINYKRSTNELSDIAKKIFEYQFKREALEIYKGADTKEFLTYAKWEERCKKLFNTFFSRDGESSGIILFPDTEIILASQISEDEIWQRVMSTLNAWCKTSSRKDATGLIIRNYDLKNHIDFCGITGHEVKNTLGLKDSENMFSFQKNGERFLVFNPSLKIIFIIRLVEIQKGESKLLKKEVDYCIDEVNLLCFLLRDELENTGVIVTGLVTCLGEYSHSQSACNDCGNMIVPFEKFGSVDSFKEFCESFVSEKNFQDLAICIATSGKKEKASLFQAVTQKILGYLAHLQFPMLRKTILPVKTNSPTGDIEQAELLLDRYQMEIAYSSDKRVWLEGNYGTGKTVVALKKLDLLSKGLKDKEVICYINFARKSPLDFVIKQRFEKNEKVRAIAGGISLSNTINHQILPKERQVGTKNVHLIVDEYSVQYLSIEEAKSLGQIFAEEQILTNSTVLIVAQPIEINRIDNFYEKGMKREFSQRKHKLDKLIQIMGMQKKILRNVMRTTVEINALAEITQEFLNNQSNEYVRKQKHHEIEERRLERTFSKLPQNSGSNLRSSLSIISSNSSKNARRSEPFQFQEVTNYGLHKAKSKEMNVNSSFHSTSPKSSPSTGITSNGSSNPATRSPPFQSQSQLEIDYYQLHKLIPPTPTTFTDQGYYQKTMTKYRYTCESQIGHSIKGPLPQLVKLESSVDRFERVALIASVLNKIIKPAETERTAVIHFELGDPPRWLKSLFQTTNLSTNLAMTIEPEQFLRDKRKNLVLVKNLEFLRGLEFSDVLLILDSNEYHLRQFVPEAIARCRSNLTILIIPSLNCQPDTIADLVDEWEKNNEDDPLVSILTIGFCHNDSCKNKRNHRKPYCVNKTDASYGVHKNSKWYRNILEEIKRAGVEDILPHYAKEKEAIAL